MVITQPCLGTINHTLLTTFAARTMELGVERLHHQPDAENPRRRRAGSPAPAGFARFRRSAWRFPGSLAAREQHKVEALAEEIDELPAYHWLLAGLGLPALHSSVYSSIKKPGELKWLPAFMRVYLKQILI